MFIFRAGFWKGVYHLADPKITMASMAAIFLGACAAKARGALEPGMLGLIIIGIWCLETAKNASGEIFDFDSGADPGVKPEDRSPFSGGKRVIVDSLLTRGETKGVAAAFYAACAAIGLWIALARVPGVLCVGLTGAALAYFYNAPPFQLSYHGWGEAAVGVVYGPLIGGGTYLALAGGLPWRVLALMAPLGLAVAAFLWINEFPDYDADRAAGKRNWVVRLGREKAARVFGALVATTAVALGLLPLTGIPRAVWLGELFLVPALLATVILRRAPTDISRIIPAQALSLAAFLTLSLGAGIGILMR